MMKKRSIFFAPQGLISQRWQQAFPDCVITDRIDGRPVDQHCLCWVVSALPEWQAGTQTLVQQGATVIVLSLTESREELLFALAAGARGYVHALAAGATLKAAATSVGNGGLWLGNDFISDLIKGINHVNGHQPGSGSRQAIDNREAKATTNPALDTLTSREREVCLLVASARSNKEVARELNITERTIKAHLSSAFVKLQIRDRVQLALLVNGQSASADDDEVAPEPHYRVM